MVSTDKEAFDHVRGRLVGDVGGLFDLINKGQLGHIPFWSMLRMTFPVAESIADLMHGSSSSGTSQSLHRLLENELEAVRPGYKPVAAILALLYRHSLTHQDVPRTIKSAGREVLWKMSHNKGRHLVVTPESPTRFIVEFDPRVFYGDLVTVLENAALTTWGNQAKDCYNSWQVLDLDAEPKPNGGMKAAIKEIAALK